MRVLSAPDRYATEEIHFDIFIVPRLVNCLLQHVYRKVSVQVHINIQVSQLRQLLAYKA